MPWFKVDDNLAFHHKVLAAGNPAMGLWVRSGSICAQQLTDGFIPDHMIVALGTKAQAEKLVTVGLWDRAQGGYRFHEWGERQPSKVDVEAERAAAADRMRQFRARKKGTTQKDSPQVSDSRAPEQTENFGVGSPEVRDMFGNPIPTRPDPTHPDPPIDALASTDVEPTNPKTKRAIQRPDDFRPNQAHIDLAAELGIDLHTEWQQFCDHHDAKGSTYKDWAAALRTWIRNAKKYGRSTVADKPSRVQQHLQLARDLAAQEQTIPEIGEAQ